MNYNTIFDTGCIGLQSCIEMQPKMGMQPKQKGGAYSAPTSMSVPFLKRNVMLGVFDVFRDRQLTNSYFSNNACDIRVIKARNISNDGTFVLICGFPA